VLVSTRVKEAFEWLGTVELEELDPRNYRESYWGLVILFRRFVDLGQPLSMLAGAAAVYGWMPRVFGGIENRVLQPILPILRRVRDSKSAAEAHAAVSDSADPERLLRFVNGSVVGTSKFLHFLNPTVAPIWDSRVARALGLDGAWKVDRDDRYREYWAAIAECGEEAPSALKTFCRSPDGEMASEIRLREYALFLKGRAP